MQKCDVLFGNKEFIHTFALSYPINGKNMNQMFIHILLSGIIILLSRVSGSGCCA
ncbi:hypothetical protein IX307_001545 [Bacteroides pyogenes]|nr:hypothetical protein [Bacteroides pyogenes]MBR8717089.1 hypothetical protein [Bacteroides pyogenes]MBR8720412.1 hypothetical protein [Bacteroides pyogenes]MBR8723914.1 hypothetical protein [Bacteroides pyogenes]MBR8737067.1 hypothetical protein [Bacteroides pyogenes]